MSFEGYAQCICANGHYFTDNADAYNPPHGCPCKAPTMWENVVDDTNCDSYGKIPLELLEKEYLISPAIYEKCNLGHTHEISSAIFQIPIEEDTDKMRYRHEADDLGNQIWIPIQWNGPSRR
jgi:hypothetical protein